MFDITRWPIGTKSNLIAGFGSLTRTQINVRARDVARFRPVCWAYPSESFSRDNGWLADVLREPLGKSGAA